MERVIIVGGGPAGLLIAKYLGEKAIVLEEHEKIGEPTHCTGLVSTRIEEVLDFPKSCILNRIRGAKIYAPSGKEYVIDGGETKAYVIDRKKFDSYLAEAAEKAGAEIRCKAKASDFRCEKEGVFVKVGGKKIKGKIAVDASGTGFFSQKSEKLLIGVQAEFEGEFDPEFVELYFGREVAPGFFAWRVPLSKNYGRVGLAVPFDRDIRIFFESFVTKMEKEQKIIRSSQKNLIGGLIPVGMRRSAEPGLLRVGDAAGQVKALSGGGIVTGAICAKIGADAIEKAMAENNFSSDFLKKNYEEKWKSKIGKELWLSLQVNNFLGSQSDEYVERIFRILKDEKVVKIIEKYGDMDFLSKIILPLLRNPLVWPNLLKLI